MSEDQIQESLEVYRYLNRKGGYYTKMFTGQSIEYLAETLDKRKTELESKKLLEKDSVKRNEIEAQITKINALLIEFSSFFTEK